MDASDFRDKTHIFSKQRNFFIFFSDDKMDTFLSAGGFDLFTFLKYERGALCRGSLRSSVSAL